MAKKKSPDKGGAAAPRKAAAKKTSRPKKSAAKKGPPKKGGRSARASTANPTVGEIGGYVVVFDHELSEVERSSVETFFEQLQQLGVLSICEKPGGP
ncbi:MAG: hypothetical protein ACJ8G7_20290 [Rhizobacter sp.]